MTCITPALGLRGSGQVLRVIEFHVETLFELWGKGAHRRRSAAHAGVTD